MLESNSGNYVSRTLRDYIHAAYLHYPEDNHLNSDYRIMADAHILEDDAFNQTDVLPPSVFWTLASSLREEPGLLLVL